MIKYRRFFLILFLLVSFFLSAEDLKVSHESAENVQSPDTSKRVQTAAEQKSLEDVQLLENVQSPSAEQKSTDTLQSSENIKTSNDEYKSLEDIPLLENAPLSIKYIPLEIPGAEHALVEKHRSHFLKPTSIAWLSSVLDNGEQYRLYVRRLLKEKNMPALLEYLPVVESNYTTRARSRSGATGLWQFMANSTKPFLIHTDFVDERYDPWRSTEAALLKLQENYKTFKDWALAIAAYNCGAGFLSRLLKKNPGKDFWFLAEQNLLSEQTANYVPKLLAIADIATNAKYYNISLPNALNDEGEPVNPRAGFFDYVSANGSISIRRLAQEMRIDEALLLSLNSALIRGITPPKQVWNIRVPEGMASSAKEALNVITAFTFQAKHTVQKGESLWAIAKAYNISLKSLCEANNISEKSILSVGKILYIPQ